MLVAGVQQLKRILLPLLLICGLACFAFVVGLCIELFNNDHPWARRLPFAGFLSGATFVAASWLTFSDWLEYRLAMKQVREKLLTGDDESEKQFVRSAPTFDVSLVLQTRQAIADFFAVPTTKIRRKLHLTDDLEVDAFGREFQLNVVGSIVSSRVESPRLYTVSTQNLESIDDLVEEIIQVIADPRNVVEPPKG